MVSQTLNPVEACKEVMSTVASGVAVLTFADDLGAMRGMTISSLTPVSADPPSVLMCIGGRASCLPSLKVGRVVVANVLGADQGAMSAGFAYGDDDPFTLFPWTRGGDGPPILDEAPAFLVGSVERIVEHHGTAVVLVGVLGGEVRHPDALVYWRKAYHRAQPLGEGGKW
jgi:flavin reductase (DIM6/NTAB) family NADH-FMN oxidoreductase RutF